MFKEYFKNQKGTDYVCGDIHGCYTDMEEKLDKLYFDPSKDRLFITGDLTDRGPESIKALGYIEQDWFIPVMGNHEDMMLQCYLHRTEDKSWHYRNGGKWILNVNKLWLNQYLKLIYNLPLIIQIGEYAIVHSSLESLDWNDNLLFLGANESYREFILWNRNENMNVQCTGIKKIYAGHTIHNEIHSYGMLEDIDTGAFLKYWDGRNGHLTIKKLGD